LKEKYQKELIEAEAVIAASAHQAQTQSEEIQAENTDMVKKGMVNETDVKALPAEAKALVASTEKAREKSKHASALREVENLVKASREDTPLKAGYSGLNATINKAISQGTSANIITVVQTKSKKGHETSTKIIDSDNNEFVLVKSKDSAPLTDSQLMNDMVVLLLAASLFGLISRLMKMPVLLGYIVAGVVIGPAHMGYIESFIQVETFAQFGVTFLLYVLGMEFSIKKIIGSWKVALIGGLLAIIVTIIFVCSLLFWIGTGFQEAIFTGAFLSMSSTTVVLKCVEDNPNPKPKPKPKPNPKPNHNPNPQMRGG